MPAPFYRVEVGQEATAGTSVASTAKLAALRFHPPLGDKNIVQPEEERGNLTTHYRSYEASQLAEGTLEGDATFEELIIPLCMAIEDNDGTTSTTSGGTTIYDWTFEPTWTSSNSPGTWTVRFGDDVGVWMNTYTFGTGLTLSGSTEESWQVSCPAVAKGKEASAFDSASVDGTVESILMQKTKLYVHDETSSDIDTTSNQVTGAFLDFEWNLPEHYGPRFTADGNLYLSGVRECKMNPELTLTLVLDATTKTYITSQYENQTKQMWYIVGEGSDITSGYPKNCKIKHCGTITDVSEIGEQDCDSIVSLTISGQYGDTWGKLFAITLQHPDQFPYGESS